jgi:cyclase
MNAHNHLNPQNHATDDHAHPAHAGHHHGSRRAFLQRLGGAMAGASILELSFFRAAVARAQAPLASGPLFKIQKVADGVYCALAHPQIITNCNASIFVRAQDVVVVDAHSKPSAAASLIAQIKQEITTKPVRYLVNSHFHYDHTQGDPAYKAQNSKLEIIASETTKTLIQQNARNRLKDTLDGIPPMMDTLRARLTKTTSASEKAFCNDQIRQLQNYQAEMKAYTPEIPDITFDKTYVLRDQAHDLHLEFHGRAHTAGDITVFCPQQRVVATGDMISGFLPSMGDGYPRDWPATIDSVGKLAADQMMPGHGSVQPNHDRMTQLRNYIEELTALVESGKKSGKSIADLQKTITVPSLKTLQSNGYAGYVAENLKNFSVYIGSRTALEDRLSGNIDAIYHNLDRA